MSLTLVTALQMGWVLVCYTALTLALPTLVFWRKLKHMGTAERFLFCVVVGNFWIISAVLMLLLLGISSRLMLLLFTYGLGLFVLCLRHRKQMRVALVSFGNLLLWTVRGELRAGLLFRRAGQSVGRWLRGRLQCFGRWFRPRWLELTLVSVCLLVGFWFCGYQTCTQYSLATSDLPVHLYWVNNMLDGTLYVRGVYPYGFHAILYYLAMITGIDTLTLFRVFGPVESLYIFLMLYLFIRSMCKCKYSAIIGLAVFTMSSAFGYYSVWRYQAALPQEYAMLFLYPAGYYLERYYRLYRRKRRSEYVFARASLAAQEQTPGVARQQYAHARQRNVFVRLWDWIREPKPLRNSTYLLSLFMLSLLLTLAVHFYITIALGVLCVAITLANLPGSLNPRPFLRLMLFVLLGVLIALSPMILAYATGTPLEGSINWAVSVMDTSGKAKEDPIMAQIESPDLTKGNYSLFEKVYLLLKSAYQYTRVIVTQGQWSILVAGVLLVTLACCALGFFVLRRKGYVRRWLGVILYLFVFVMIPQAKMLGLPVLMARERCAIFIAYASAVLFAFPFDLLYCLMTLWKKATRACNAMMCAVCYSLMIGFQVLPAPQDGVRWNRGLSSVYSLQYPETIELLYDLYDHYPLEDWTLVSPMTESNLTHGRGWHYDLGIFILDQEDWTSSTIITIPTQYVFFLVEKKPLEYNKVISLDGSTPLHHEEVSAASAAGELPDISALTGPEVYSDYRTIIESKIYYWAQAFQKLYPYEMEVYFENDHIVCYRLTQNPSKLYNLAIDYGYNTARPTEEASVP